MKTIKKKGQQALQSVQSHFKSPKSDSGSSGPDNTATPTPATPTPATPTPATPAPAIATVATTALQALKVTLRVLKESSDAFPPLKSAVGGLLAIIDLFDTSTGNYTQFSEMKDRLGVLDTIVRKYKGRELPSLVEKRLENMAEAIEFQNKAIEQMLKRSKVDHILFGSEDAQKAQNIIQCINALLDRFQFDIVQNTELAVQDLLNMTIQDRLKAAADASFKADKHSSCMENTRVAILSSLFNWATDQDSSPVFWLSGIAGTGKSTIAQSLCEFLDKHRLLGGSFFCSRDFADRSDVRKIIPSIAESLSLQHRAYQERLVEILKYEPGVASQSPKRQFEILLLQPFRMITVASLHQVVVIDALDECSDLQATSMILSLLMAHATVLPFKIFLSSRPETAIQEELQQAQYKETFSLHDIESDIVQKDIHHYLSAKLQNLPYRHKLEAEFPDFVLQLTKMADRLFIYAFTVQSYLRSPDPLSHFRILSASKSAGFSSINQLYTQVLQSSIPLVELPEQAEIEQMHRKYVLHTVVSLFNPLSAKQIQDLLSIQVDDLNVDASLSFFHSLLSIPDSTKFPDHPITVFHVSFMDYIVHEKQCLSVYHLNSAEHHAFLTLCCLKYMHSRLKQNVCSIQTDTEFNTLSQSTIAAQCMQEAPALMYCCQYWADHWSQAGSNISVQHLEALQTFLSSHFLKWLENLSLLQKLAFGAPSLYKVAQSLQKLNMLTYQASIQELQVWLHEGRAFILQVADCISKRPLEVYHAALMWIPEDSVLGEYKTSHLSDGNAKIICGIEKNWGACEQVLHHPSAVYDATFSSDGSWVASGCHDGKTRIWNPSTGEVEQIFLGHSAEVRSVAFSSDKQYVVSGSQDGDIRLWSITTGEAVHMLKGHSAAVTSLAFSPNGQQLASGSEDGNVRIWNVVTGMVEYILKGDTFWVQSVAFSPDNQQVVCATSHGDIKIWNSTTGELKHVFNSHTGPVFSTSFSPNGQKIVSGSSDDNVRIWNIPTGKVERVFEGHSNIVYSAAFSFTGKQVVSGSFDGEIRVWDAATGEVEHTFKAHSGRASVAFSPNNQQVLSGSSDGDVRIWNLVTKEVMPKAKGHTEWVNLVAFDPKKHQVVSESEDGETRIWNATAGEVEQVMKGYSGWVTSVAFSTTTELVASGSNNGVVRIWYGDTGGLKHVLQGHSDRVKAVAFSHNSQMVVSGSENCDVKIWKVDTGDMVQEFKVTSPVSLVAFSRDGSQVLAKGWNSAIEILNVIKNSSTSTTSYTPFYIYYLNEDNSELLMLHSVSNRQYVNKYVLWIPPKYRDILSISQAGSNVCFGLQSGIVTILDMRSEHDRLVSMAL